MGFMSVEGYINYYRNLLETQSSSLHLHLYDKMQGDAFARRDT